MKNALLLLSTYAVVLLSACSNEKNIHVSEERFQVTTPIILDTNVIKEYTADIQAVENVEIRARIKSFIDVIHVDEGQNVRANQLLFTLNSKEYTQELSRANAQLRIAIAESKMQEVVVNNSIKLVEKNIVSTSELALAKAKLETSLAKIEEVKSTISSANLNISLASVRAPFDGVINRLPLKTGSFIDEGSLLTTISNDKEVFAYFNLSEKQYLGILKDKENTQQKIVKLIMTDGQLYNQLGKIETAESEINKSTGNLAFRARFKNPERLLKHGASGKIQLENYLPKALLIPQKVTFEVQDQSYVYVVNSNNIVELRNIVVSQRLSHIFVVKSGLSSSDRIIYEGIQRVKEGERIIPEMKPMKAILSELAINKF